MTTRTFPRQRSLFYSPGADWRLLAPAWEFNHSRRIVVYLYKALTGLAIALLAALTLSLAWIVLAGSTLTGVAFTLTHAGAVPTLAGACLAIYVATKVQWHIEHWHRDERGHINALDVVFDGALTLAWVIPFERGSVVMWHVLVLLVLYPWSQE